MLESLGEASQAEIMRQIAHPPPVRIIAKMLGIPDVMQPQLVESRIIAVSRG